MVRVFTVQELRMVEKQKIRCYVTKENSSQFPHLTNSLRNLDQKKFIKIGTLIGKDLNSVC